MKRSIGVGNGTDALVIALDALEIGPGDEVICPAFTFYATAESIARRGATPVFADVDPATLNLDPEDVARKVTDRTRAIMPVHLFGRPLPLDELLELGLPVVEDAAQAFGAPGVAQRGALATYSFFPTKNLFCLGDGGLVATNDEELAERVQMLSFHGSRDKTDFDFVGYNSRLDEVQAGHAAPLPAAARPAGTGAAARPPRATRSSAWASSSTCRRTSRATSTTSSSAARPSATASAQRSPRRASAARRTTRRRSTCSRRCASSATSPGRCR